MCVDVVSYSLLASFCQQWQPSARLSPAVQARIAFMQRRDPHLSEKEGNCRRGRTSDPANGAAVNLHSCG